MITIINKKLKKNKRKFTTKINEKVYQKSQWISIHNKNHKIHSPGFSMFLQFIFTIYLQFYGFHNLFYNLFTIS